MNLELENLPWQLRASHSHHNGPKPIMLPKVLPEEFEAVEAWLRAAEIKRRAGTHNDVGGDTNTVEKNRLGKLAELVFCKHYGLDVQMVIGSDGGSDVTMPSGLKVDVKSTDNEAFADLLIPYNFKKWGCSDVFVLVYSCKGANVFAIMGWYDCLELKKTEIKTSIFNPVFKQSMGLPTRGRVVQTHNLNDMETFDGQR